MMRIMIQQFSLVNDIILYVILYSHLKVFS